MIKEELSGYPSIDKPWLKYYSEEAMQSCELQCTAYELIYRGNKNYPHDIALNYFGHKITYGELFEKIDMAANAYYAAGVRKNDVVIFCMVNMPETIYSLYALNKLGAVVNLVDLRTNEQQMQAYVQECNAEYVLTVDIAYPVMERAIRGSHVKKVIVVSSGESLEGIKKVVYRIKTIGNRVDKQVLSWKKFVRLGKRSQAKTAEYEKEKCFVIAHTGGTTGIPKGVMLSDDNINAVAQGYQYLGIPFKRQHKYFNDLPPFIIYGLTLAIHTTLCYGLQVILYPVFDSKNFPNEFVKYRPNHFSALSDHLKYLAESKKTQKMNLSFLISAGVGGDSLNTVMEEKVNGFLRQHHCSYEVCKGYGMTELAATAVISTPKANAIGSVGIPLVHNTIKIVDIDTGEELSYGEVGEIWISGPSIMLGYYKNQEATKEIITLDETGQRWIHTGDLGYINKDGLLFHQGRIRRIYLTAVGGQPAKIFPNLVEDAIKSAEPVADCTVVARFKQNSAYYEAVAYVILKDEAITMDQAQCSDLLQKICRDRVPTYMCPVEYRYVSEFPHTPIGKVDFRKLEEMATLNKV